MGLRFFAPLTFSGARDHGSYNNFPEHTEMTASLAMFDTKTKANAGVEVELTSPRTFEGTGVFITVHGTDSDQFRKASAEMARRTLELSQAGGGKVDQEQRDELQANLLAACTIGWRGLVDEDITGEDKNVPFTKAKVAQIYLSHPVIREQVDAAIANRQAFLKA